MEEDDDDEEEEVMDHACNTRAIEGEYRKLVRRPEGNGILKYKPDCDISKEIECVVMY